MKTKYYALRCHYPTKPGWWHFENQASDGLLWFHVNPEKAGRAHFLRREIARAYARAFTKTYKIPTCVVAVRGRK